MQINRRTVLGGGTMIAGLSASASAATKKSGGGKTQSKALSKLASYVDQHRSDWAIPGMTACMVDNNGFSGIVNAGWADADQKTRVNNDHLFQVGSITKMMTALTAWSLIDEGKLSPEARLADLIPELSVRNGDQITLQHLLNHTSGLPRSAPLIYDDGLWSGFEPGTRWAYCNLGYKIVGLIIARADEQLFPESVEARLLRPLGMNASVGAMREIDRDRYARGYQPATLDRPAMRPSARAAAPWANYDGASGCVGATASDMTLFLKFLIGLSNGQGGAVFSNATAERFLSNAADAPGWSEGSKYGNGIAQMTINERAYLHHTGGMVSFSSSLHVDRAAGVAAFASGNIHYATNYRPRDVTLFACQLLQSAQDETTTPEPKPTRPVVKEPETLAGVFTAENGDAFEIIALEKQVEMKRNGQNVKMQIIGDKHFACAADDFATTGLQFEFENEKVIRVWAGNVEYLADTSVGYLPAPSPALQALEGRYENDDRWGIAIRVFARGEKLVIKSANYVSTLTQLENGDWRPGDKEWWPDWIRFDGFMNGKATRMLSSGNPFDRRFS